jgi:hypothetical protein
MRSKRDERTVRPERELGSSWNETGRATITVGALNRLLPPHFSLNVSLTPESTTFLAVMPAGGCAREVVLADRDPPKQATDRSRVP